MSPSMRASAQTQRNNDQAMAKPRNSPPLAWSPPRVSVKRRIALSPCVWLPASTGPERPRPCRTSTIRGATSRAVGSASRSMVVTMCALALFAAGAGLAQLGGQPSIEAKRHGITMRPRLHDGHGQLGIAERGTPARDHHRQQLPVLKRAALAAPVLARIPHDAAQRRWHKRSQAGVPDPGRLLFRQYVHIVRSGLRRRIQRQLALHLQPRRQTLLIGADGAVLPGSAVIVIEHGLGLGRGRQRLPAHP